MYTAYKLQSTANKVSQ